MPVGIEAAQDVDFLLLKQIKKLIEVAPLHSDGAVGEEQAEIFWRQHYFHKAAFFDELDRSNALNSYH